MDIDFVFSIIILIFSVVIHEVSHGFVAYSLGDNTAKNEGRLTLNPFKHLEWFNSFILPVISYLSFGFIFGMAKPVPFNPYNLSDQKWGEAKVAIAGPLSNLFIALIFGTLIRTGVLPSLGIPFVYIGSMIVLINLVLFIFNLVPVPPLDGSKVLFSLLPYNMLYIRDFLERNSLFFVIIFVLFLWKLVTPAVTFLFTLITGLP